MSMAFSRPEVTGEGARRADEGPPFKKLSGRETHTWQQTSKALAYSWRNSLATRPLSTRSTPSPNGRGPSATRGVQVPSWDGRLFDLKKAAESKTYCDELKGIAKQNGVEITELSTHLQGHLVAIHPTYDEAVDGFAPAAVHGNPKARQEWACEQIKLAAKSFERISASPVRYPSPAHSPGPSFTPGRHVRRA